MLYRGRGSWMAYAGVVINLLGARSASWAGQTGRPTHFSATDMPASAIMGQSTKGSMALMIKRFGAGPLIVTGVWVVEAELSPIFRTMTANVFSIP